MPNSGTVVPGVVAAEPFADSGGSLGRLRAPKRTGDFRPRFIVPAHTRERLPSRSLSKVWTSCGDRGG